MRSRLRDGFFIIRGIQFDEARYVIGCIQEIEAVIKHRDLPSTARARQSVSWMARPSGTCDKQILPA
jgi:hypothetical protein